VVVAPAAQELATWVETNSGWPVSGQLANGQVSSMNSGQTRGDLTPGTWAIRTSAAAIGQLRQLNSEVLAVAVELSHGTTETVLAKSDLELGIEALARGLQDT